MCLQSFPRPRSVCCSTDGLDCRRRPAPTLCPSNLVASAALMGMNNPSHSPAPIFSGFSRPGTPRSRPGAFFGQKNWLPGGDKRTRTIPSLSRPTFAPVVQCLWLQNEVSRGQLRRRHWAECENLADVSARGGNVESWAGKTIQTFSPFS